MDLARQPADKVPGCFWPLECCGAGAPERSRGACHNTMVNHNTADRPCKVASSIHRLTFFYTTMASTSSRPPVQASGKATLSLSREVVVRTSSKENALTCLYRDNSNQLASSRTLSTTVQLATAKECHLRRGSHFSSPALHLMTLETAVSPLARTTCLLYTTRGRASEYRHF